MLSYLFTPMIIPVTATIAAGRKRRRKRDQSSQFNLTLPTSDFTLMEEPNVIPLIDLTKQNITKMKEGKSDNETTSAINNDWSKMENTNQQLKVINELK